MTLADYPLALVCWHQPGCGHCEEFLPVLARTAPEYPHVVTLSVDASRNERLADAFDVRSTPTVTLLAHGRTVARSDGAPSEDELRAMYARALARAQGAA